MKNNINSVITIIFAFLLVIFLSFIPKVNTQKDFVSENNVENTLNLISSKVGKDYKKVSEIELSSDIINVVYNNPETNNYKSYFIDKISGKQLSYTSILRKSKIDSFSEVEQQLLKEKYPLFIVNGINNSKVDKVVYIKGNSLVIIYNNVITEPIYNEQINLTINYNMISDYLNYQHELDEEYQNESGYDYDETKKYIAFTFDDGPSKKNTNDIVQYLTDNKMHATFFMVGNFMANNTSIVKNVYDNNMEIGSHSWNHTNMKKQKINDLSIDMKKTEEVYNSITGDTLKLLRPPYGAINNEIKETFNYSYILWNVDSEDWKYKDADHLYDFIINNVEDGDIVLMHDLHESTKVGVERILPELYVRGYRVVSVSELANIKGKTLETNKTYRSMK